MEVKEKLSNGNTIVYTQLENGTCYHRETRQDAINVLERARYRGDRIRIFYGDTTTGRCWDEENDVVGRVGRSTGGIKIPLLINNARSSGGPAILDHCIVKIIDRNKKTLYQHEKFHQGTFSVGPGNKPEIGFVANVYKDGEVYARMMTIKAAERLRDFMIGNRFTR